MLILKHEWLSAKLEQIVYINRLVQNSHENPRKFEQVDFVQNFFQAPPETPLNITSLSYWGV